MNIRNSLGLDIDFQDNGSVRSIAVDPIKNQPESFKSFFCVRGKPLVEKKD